MRLKDIYEPMTKNESTILKGIAILMMVFIHTDLSRCQASIEGLRFYELLQCLCVPVPLFLIGGGYGLYFVNKHIDKRRYTRILGLYEHFWIILFSFMLIGCFLKPDRYPGTLADVFLNFSSLHTTWNPECWFLLPYSILSLSSVYIFRIADRFRIRYVLLVAFLVHLVTAFLISRLHVQYMSSSPWLYYSLYLPNMLLCFLMGAMACRCDFFAKVRGMNKIIVLLLLIAASLLKIFIQSAVLSPFYAIGIVISFVVLFDGKECKPLSLLGKHSMNIWLMHTWIFSYLFGRYFYSLGHPILIMLVLLIVCILLSYIVDWIHKKLSIIEQNLFKL